MGPIQISQDHILTRLEHGELFITTPVSITWVFMLYAALLCTPCDVGKSICDQFVSELKTSRKECMLMVVLFLVYDQCP